MPRLLYRRIRAPEQSGAALIAPALDNLPSLIARNQQLLSTQPLANGFQLGAAAHDARRELLELALRHTGRYRDVSFAAAFNGSHPFLLSGHQPELFHPGVWFKNFLLSELAKRTQSVPINLLIDTDAVHGVGIRVPSLADGRVRVSAIPFDGPGSASAWEERPVLDAELFASFAARVTAAFGTIAPQPANDRLLVNRLWQNIPHSPRGAMIGMLLAQARHCLEADYGLQSLEAPMSGVAQTASFRRFALFLLGELPAFREIYNSALADYRRVNRIRSHTHPVPALAGADGWLEAPFFIWTRADPSRRALFVRRRAAALEATDREHVSLTLGPSPDDTILQLAELEARGIKLRPRALVTTMCARLLLSDAFIHGIGGAKYDELTDAIIERFFGIQPPAYITATATFRLPPTGPAVMAEAVRHCERRIRELRFRPESFVDDPLPASEPALRERLGALAEEKRNYLASHRLRGGTKDAFSGLDALNRAMHALLGSLEQQLRARREELAEQTAQTKLLASREFSFALYDSEILPARLLDLCKVSS